MLLSDRALKFAALWKAITDVPSPQLEQFMRWCLKFEDDLMERALMKCGAKFKRTQTEPERAYRYVTKLLQNLREERSKNEREDEPMTDNNQTTPTANPTTEQLLDAVRASEPSATRDLAIDLLESGAVNADSSIADLGAAVSQHNAPSAPQE